ncbi:squalene--hopene cyclase [Algihabitans albus]|uniref:squalene--hopene cyclase n=1 Tax=Algihabitans albus TaxID=2164067 RepID=UPI0035D00714
MAMPAFDDKPSLDHVDSTISEVRDGLLGRQHSDGHWLYELEPDSTIPAEYILLQHYLDEVDPAEEVKIAKHLREIQNPDGSWPLFHGGEMNISATVKAYYALKLTGEDIEAPHMAAARQRILEAGGAAKANVFTRIALALFGQVPWRAVPVMPVEIMHLPRWSPFHLSKVSYWSRTVIVPLLVLMALKPQARNPRGVHIRELFVTPPERERDYIANVDGTVLGAAFVNLDRVLRSVEPLMPAGARQRAVDKAVAWTLERLNGEDGLGAIFPAMANAVMMFDALGYAKDEPNFRASKQAIKNLLHDRGETLYCQPCVSPIWDTVLSMHAVQEAGVSGREDSLRKAAEWILEREVTDVKGDWAIERPHLEPSGWAFQYANAHYPDLDDTAVVVMALHRADPEGYKDAIERATAWILGMQSTNGGWGSFDADNTHYYLNHIPFADHGALLDPPTADVSARCLSMLGQLGYGLDHPAVAKGVQYLLREQEDDGSWFGRWGSNYIYGTWSVLCALNAVGFDMARPEVAKAVTWLKARQLPDGGWGESLDSYHPDRKDACQGSTASQTAWALLGLMAAGEVQSETVEKGVAHLVNAPREDERWDEPFWTGTGFPRVFYLKYHGYAAYFPLWALARYANLKRSNSGEIEVGM